MIIYLILLYHYNKFQSYCQIDNNYSVVNIFYIKESLRFSACWSISSAAFKVVSVTDTPPNAIIVEAKNELNLNKGDIVTLYEDTRKVMKYAFIGYGLLAILLVVGAIVGYVLTKRDIMALVSAALFVAVGFLIIKFSFRNIDSEFTIKSVERQNIDE